MGGIKKSNTTKTQSLIFTVDHVGSVQQSDRRWHHSRIISLQSPRYTAYDLETILLAMNIQLEPCDRVSFQRKSCLCPDGREDFTLKL